jgi:hypothetical protein
MTPLELLTHPAATSTAALEQTLLKALATIGGCWTYAVVPQQTLGQDDVRRWYPAPTLLYHGHDLFGLTSSAAVSASAVREYPDGVPTHEQMLAALRSVVRPRIDHDMPTLIIEVSSAPVLLRCTWFGEAPTPAQSDLVRRRMRAEGHLTAETRLLLDMREMAVPPSPDVLREAMTRPWPDGVRPRAAAFVTAAGSLPAGTARLDLHLAGGPIGAVFVRDTDALEWLTSR